MWHSYYVKCSILMAFRIIVIYAIKIIFSVIFVMINYSYNYKYKVTAPNRLVRFQIFVLFLTDFLCLILDEVRQIFDKVLESNTI